MLDIFTDNWDELPTLNDGERLVHIVTGNPCDVLYTIIDGNASEDEIDEDIIFALRHKFGRRVRYRYTEDMMYLYERLESARKDAKEAWDGEGYYRIGWSDGGMDWTSNGPVWFDDESDLASELLSAYDSSMDTHLPYAEKVKQFQQYELDALLGDFKDDFDVDAIIHEATRPCSDGNRYWVVEGDELSGIIESCEK